MFCLLAALRRAVYIQEAHAKDEWPVGEQVSFCEQPKTLEARLAVARHFVEAAQFDLVSYIACSSDFISPACAAVALAIVTCVSL